MKADINKYFAAFAIGAIMIITLHAHAEQEPEQHGDAVFQASVFDALMRGVYEGVITYGELKEHGDFGLGTFNDLDGEMVALDGVFYRIDSEGTVSIVQDSMKSPFAVVTFFDSNERLVPEKKLSCEGLQDFIYEALPTKNIFYAIKVDGEFEYLKIRSVHAQHKPYPPVSEVVKNQSEFEHKNIKGTFVGYWMPVYIGGVAQAGYHFHFISDDKKSGGHVLECKTDNIVIDIDHIRDFELDLPETEPFENLKIDRGDKN